ncbi:MAG TPA: TRAP transporter small permease [Burkholderiales bacterium]|nr:TRAP transporter small permease [Burkholderiales bacterium]
MDSLLRLARLVARAGCWFGGAMVAAAALMIAVDVLARKLFSVSIGASSEVSGYVLAIGTSWALTLALLDRAHVRIDSLYTVLPVRLCALLDMVALASFMVFAAFTTWQGGKVLLNSIQVDAHSLTPLGTLLAIPQTLWVAGFVLFSAVLLLLFVRAAMLLARGRWEDVQRLLGPRTAQQELAEALHEHERYKA